MDRLPYFPFYADDFLMGVSDMTDAEVGVYSKLLSISWSKNGANDQATFAASRDQATIDRVLERKFYRDENGLWRNKKLEQIREIQHKKRSSGSKGGSKSQANHEAKGQAKAKLQNQNQSISREDDSERATDDISLKESNPASTARARKKTAETEPHGFAEFWAAYPHKESKKPARDAYRSALARLSETMPQDEAAEKLRTAAADYREYLHDHHSPPRPKFAQGWLNDERYETDYVELRSAEARKNDRDDPRGNLAMRERLLREMQEDEQPKIS